MRWVIISMALGLTACAASRDIAAVEDWKRTARAECQKDTDLIRREQCLQQVNTVSSERTRTEETRPRR